MEQQLFDFLSVWMSGALGLFTDLFSGIPVANKAIIWMVFVMLVMNLIIIPIRGAGMSDRAIARDVLSGRSESTKQIVARRQQRKK